MADGFWGNNSYEGITQKKLTRHRLLKVNTGGGVGGSPPIDTRANLDPNNIVGAVAFPFLGPHFIMSPEAPSGLPTTGFEFCLLGNPWMGDTQAPFLPDAGVMTLAAGGVDVTVWVLISNGQKSQNNAFQSGLWASFATLTGVQFNQLFSSFDIDASPIRFQIGPGGISVNGDVTIAFSEL